jgi:general secretion pathway protein N
MMNPRLLAGLGLACFVLFALAQFPASAAFALLAPAGISGFGFSGTIWRGTAGVIDLPGLQLRSTEWDLAGMRLLTGQLGGRFKTRWDGGFADGYAARSLLGNLVVADTQANFTAASLTRAAGLPVVDGQITFAIERLELDGTWPDHVVGRVDAKELASSLIGAGSAGALGNATAAFDSSAETEPDTVTGQISDTGGPLELSGTLVLTRPSDYRLSVRVKPRASASAELQQNLRFLGQPDASGSYPFELSGSY